MTTRSFAAIFLSVFLCSASAFASITISIDDVTSKYAKDSKSKVLPKEALKFITYFLKGQKLIKDFSVNEDGGYLLVSSNDEDTMALIEKFLELLYNEVNKIDAWGNHLYGQAGYEANEDKTAKNEIAFTIFQMWLTWGVINLTRNSNEVIDFRQLVANYFGTLETNNNSLENTNQTNSNSKSSDLVEGYDFWNSQLN